MQGDLSMSLSAENLCFSYHRSTQPVVREVSLAMPEGRIIVLLGPNGSGKSTLLRLMLGELTPASGGVTWKGRALSQWPVRERARRIAYLPQSPQYHPGERVSEVLRAGRMPFLGALGLESARDMEVIGAVCEKLELRNLLDRPMDELSGGQRQRVFLGRALVQEPSVFLLDEPNTFLDLRHQSELWRVLREVARERNLAILAASHDLNLSAAFADELVLLEGGRIAARGMAQEVLRAELLSRVYGVEMERLDRTGRTPIVVPVVD